MKKILFIVCTHGNELAGLHLFLTHPYGMIKNIQWEVLIGNPEGMMLNQRFLETDLNRSFDAKWLTSYEEKRAEILKKRMQQYDVVYDVHTTQAIKLQALDDCMFVNTIDANVIQACSYIAAKHIIWDSDRDYNKRYLTGHHPVGVTLEYQKSSDHFEDVNRIMSDFYNIVGARKSHVFPKHLYKADRPITHSEQYKYKLNLSDFHLLSEQDKKILKLKGKEEYVPVFVNPPEVDQKYYCFLNRKIKIVV